MNYLLAAEFDQYGLETTTPESWTAAASALIDAHCRRPTLGVTQYVERTRINPGRNIVHLSYLPLTALAPATSAIVKVRGRYAVVEARQDQQGSELAVAVSQVFALPGTWTDINAAAVDYDPATGEAVMPLNVLALPYNEVEVTYTAGLAAIPDAVKFACSQIVKNAQATPALNVKSGRLNQMKLEYFADSLLDASVQKMLAPYVAQRMS